MMVDRHGSRELAPYANISVLYLDAEFQSQDHTKRRSEADIRKEFRAALADSVRHHLVSDVPVGAFLSSGVDSGALVGMMRDAGQTDIRTVTPAFDEFDGTANDESPLANLGLTGTGPDIRPAGSVPQNSRLICPHILAAMDQPSIYGINRG